MIAEMSEKIPGSASMIIQAIAPDGREGTYIIYETPGGENVDWVAENTGNVITELEVSRWFTDAGVSLNLSTPECGHSRAIASMLNILRVTNFQLNDIHRENDVLKQVKQSLIVLKRELPALVKGSRQAQTTVTERGVPVLPTSGVASVLEGLQAAVVEAIPFFVFPSPGTRRATWHDVADYVATNAVEAWMSANSRQLGIGRPTSPAVVFVGRALDRLNVQDGDGNRITPDAIAKALSRRKKVHPQHRAAVIKAKS